MITLRDATIEMATINGHDSALKVIDVEFEVRADCRAVVTEKEMMIANGTDLETKLRSFLLDRHTLLLAPPSVTGDVLELIRAVCAGSTTALPKLIDELIHQGHEPDGDEPVTPEWLRDELGMVVTPLSATTPDGKITFDRWNDPVWQYRQLKLETRRDARAIVRMGGYK